MNMYDKAYELAKALRESQEAQDLREARQAAEADAESRRMLDDFRQRQELLQQKMMGGEEPSQAEMDMMNNLYEVLSLNPHISRLFEAERRFSAVFDDVNRILTEALRQVFE